MLVIFDCDGTLIDSEIIASAIDADALCRLGRPTTPAEFSRAYTGIPHKEIWDRIERDMGVPLPDGFFEALKRESIRRFAEELQAVEGVHEAIEAVARLGLRSCIASSTYMDGLRRNLATTRLLDLFDPHVFSASQVARGKPAPDVFLYAASQMGADPADCLVLEDSVAGVTAARRAGMPVVGFVGGGHADEGLGERLREAGAATVLAAMAEVPGMVAAHFGVG